MAKYCLVGGSSGLGKTLVKRLIELGHDVVIISRSCPLEISRLGVRHIKCNLGEPLGQKQLERIYERLGTLDGFCFCQRYRPEGDKAIKGSHCFSREYTLLVESTYKLLRYYISHNSGEHRLVKAIIVGSTYAENVGFDQGPSYHCSKAAQKALVNYMACHYPGRLLITTVNPPTYIKGGAEQYWKSTERFRRWIAQTGSSMPTVDEIAGVIIEVFQTENLLISGNHLFLDNGMSKMYFDQIKQWS